jgi:tryptophanyl-tRNA synthetase
VSVLSPINNRVLSGMRATGKLHLGHYHGVLKNWVQLQEQYDCYFFVADWHGLTTNYEDTSGLSDYVWDLVVDWLACGVDPAKARIFIQSQVMEHAELHLLLSMCTPLSWLERVPTYKDQIDNLKGKDLATYGFLGYPLLMSADILVYKAHGVPVGEDQLAHVEITRELARRFNHLYGREPGFEQKADDAARKMGKKSYKLFLDLRNKFQEKGDHEALAEGRALLESQQNIGAADRERLLGFLDGSGRVILPEPQALLTPASKMPGLDGRKMSKSYGNTISLRDEPDEVDKKVRTMPTDPARVRRTDPGEPTKCPVWEFHKVYSGADTQEWVLKGCRSAGIGCLECKAPVIAAIQAELEPIQARMREYEQNPGRVREVVAEGREAARKVAAETLSEVRAAMGLNYR